MDIENYINERLDPGYYCVVILVEYNIIDVEVLFPQEAINCSYDCEYDCGRDSPSFKLGNFNEEWIINHLGSLYEIENLDSCSTTIGTHFTYRITLRK